MKNLVRTLIVLAFGANVYAALSKYNGDASTSDFRSFQNQDEFLRYVDTSLRGLNPVGGKVVLNSQGQVIFFPEDQSKRLETKNFEKFDRLEFLKLLELALENERKEFKLFISPNGDGRVEVKFPSFARFSDSEPLP